MTRDLRDLLEDVRASRGVLTPASVLDVARDPSHPLHHRFEWNDERAGEAHRLGQAAALIRSVRVRYGDRPEQTVRAYHVVATSRGSRYEPVEEIRENPLQREILLRSMRRDVEALRARYGHMAEFMELIRSLAA